MQYIVFRFKDTHGRKGSKATCTPTLHSFLTFLSAPCSWQWISCRVVIWGLFLFISLGGGLTSLACVSKRGRPTALLGSCCVCITVLCRELGSRLGLCQGFAEPPPNRSCPYCLSGSAWVDPGCRGSFVPLSSERSAGSCTGCNVLGL